MKYRHKVTIEIPIYTSDGVGGRTKTASKKITHHVDINPLTSGDQFLMNKFENRVSHRLVGRYRGDITTDSIVKTFDGRSLHVRSVSDPEERKKEIELICEEKGT